MTGKKKYLIIVITIFCALQSPAQDNHSLILSYQDSAKYYEGLNKNLQAYNFTNKAYALMLSTPGTDQDKLARTESDLGTFAFRMGNISLSETHHRRAIKMVLSQQSPNYESLYLSCNNMGGIMWFASKMDSALYYYNIAIDAVSRMDSTPLNKYYRPAVLYNNLAGIYGVQGKTTEGITAMKTTINNLRSFLAIKDSTLRKSNALHFQFEATDNLAGIYKELGDYRKAQELLTHSYQQKQKSLPADDPDIHKSEILLGQLYYAMNDYSAAEKFLLKGLNGFEHADGDFLFWQADAYGSLALVYEDTDKQQQAARHFELADSLYEETLDGEYDNIYLQFLRNASTFYAKNHSPAIAISKAFKGYKYISSTEGEQTLSGFYQLLNLSDVYYQLQNYREALKYSKKALRTVNIIIGTGSNILDSIKMELKKPKAILLAARCEYELLDKKTPEALKSILKELSEALSTLERRKSVIHDANDVNLLMADHKDLLDFIKKITVELYNLTKQPSYIDELISLHESGLYNRIRARLDQKSNIQFAYVPADIQATEQKLKGALGAAINGDGSHNDKMQQYIRAEEEWEQFLNTLRIKYPEYYKMRYASIFKPLKDVMQDIPAGTTVVRFIFAGKELLALVADNEHKQLISLKAAGLNDEIGGLWQHTMEAGRSGEILNKLYTRLWAPLKKDIRYKRVIIIPDGVLFNLNFEMLCPVRIKSFDEFSTVSLLAEYTISYHYSLFLLKQQNNEGPITRNFVAFTPGFSDRIKEAYRNSADTELVIDNFYMSLLPQPFTVDLAMTAGKLFGGNIFADESSTINTFRQNANGHRIIHIGTHAEADNLHPQFSRLIFSKDISHNESDNYLYLFDIYNCNLSSNLTVLTACESGKVGYEDGEGMVSLAHAFNYAGSESILMGLSKIDEQSCAILIRYFYDNLAKGMSKDEALRNAKLAYLLQSHGRALSAPYWAGLVIMGDTSPVPLEKDNNHLYLIAGLAFILLLVGVLLQKKWAASAKKRP